MTQFKRKVWLSITMLVDILLSAFLVFYARQADSAWNYCTAGVVIIFLASIAFGPGVVISCLIGLLIGSYL